MARTPPDPPTAAPAGDAPPPARDLPPPGAGAAAGEGRAAAGAARPAGAARGSDDVLGQVPFGVRVAAAWAWRGLVVAAAAAVVGYLLTRIPLVVYSVLVAVLVTALLSPGVVRLRARGAGRGLAATTMFFGAILVVAAVLAFLVWAISGQFGDVVERSRAGVDAILDWLATGPFHIDRVQVDDWIAQAQQWVRDNSSSLSGTAVGYAGRVAEFLTGAVLTLFVTFFLLYDGDRVWAWLVRLLPRDAVASTDWAAHRAWRNLVGYTRGLVLIAAIDAVGIGILLLVLRVPLAVPLAILVFFGAFIPLVGAFLTGGVAVLIALVDRGPVVALVVLAGIVAIQQVEGHLLHPLIMTRFVRLHPLAIALVVAAGTLLAGIAGAVLAVPFVAAAATFAGLLRRGEAQAAVAAGLPPDDPREAADASLGPAGPAGPTGP